MMRRNNYWHVARPALLTVTIRREDGRECHVRNLAREN